MNSWKFMVYGGAILVLLLLQLVLLPVRASSGEIRQRSDGCGRNPLITLAAAFGSGTVNLNDVLRAVKADPAVWSDMQDLLRRYDDCIRAGDGLHYKRNRGGTGGPSVYVPLSGSQQQPVIMGGSPYSIMQALMDKE